MSTYFKTSLSLTISFTALCWARQFFVKTQLLLLFSSLFFLQLLAPPCRLLQPGPSFWLELRHLPQSLLTLGPLARIVLLIVGLSLTN